LLNYLAESESKKEEVAAYPAPTTTTTTPAPPSPVLWMPGGDADCGGSEKRNYFHPNLTSLCFNLQSSVL